MRHIVIGCGGVGSWLVPKLIRLEPPDSILLMDGDAFEEKNLDRQLFSREFVGTNKAAAMSGLHGTRALLEYFTAGSMRLSQDDLLWCCADNHAARRNVLDACDLYGCQAILGANEKTESEAYFYKREWGGGPNDPRVIYPDMLTDNSGDPTRPESCAELANSGQTQTVLANGLAADFMLHLYWSWFREKIDEEFRPVHHKSSVYSVKTIRVCDRELVPAY